MFKCNGIAAVVGNYGQEEPLYTGYHDNHCTVSIGLGLHSLCAFELRTLVHQLLASLTVNSLTAISCETGMRDITLLTDRFRDMTTKQCGEINCTGRSLWVCVWGEGGGCVGCV